MEKQNKRVLRSTKLKINVYAENNMKKFKPMNTFTKFTFVKTFKKIYTAEPNNKN